MLRDTEVSRKLDLSGIGKIGDMLLQSIIIKAPGTLRYLLFRGERVFSIQPFIDALPRDSNLLEAAAMLPSLLTKSRTRLRKSVEYLIRFRICHKYQNMSTYFWASL